ncbi:unnamed protein product [Rhodiola kirilowii]
MDTKHKLSLFTAPPLTDPAPLLTDPAPYIRLIGQLIYLTNTRPNLAYSVHILSQFMHQPTQDHLSATHKVLRYLKGAPAQGFFYPSDQPLQLTTFCDADWGACPLTRKSVSAEAEYRTMAHACYEGLVVVRLLADLHVQVPTPVPLFCDNNAAMHIARNPIFHERTKHVELDCHVVRQHVSAGFIQPHFVPTFDQPADLLTKALSADQLSHLCGKINVSNKLHMLSLRRV